MDDTFHWICAQHRDTPPPPHHSPGPERENPVQPSTVARNSIGAGVDEGADTRLFPNGGDRRVPTLANGQGAGPECSEDEYLNATGEQLPTEGRKPPEPMGQPPESAHPRTVLEANLPTGFNVPAGAHVFSGQPGHQGHSMSASHTWDPSSWDSLIPSPSDLLDSICEGDGQQPAPPSQSRPDVFHGLEPPSALTDLVARVEAVQESAASAPRLTYSEPLAPAQSRPQPKSSPRLSSLQMVQMSAVSDPDIASQSRRAFPTVPLRPLVESVHPSTQSREAVGQRDYRRSSETSVTVHVPFLSVNSSSFFPEAREYWGGPVTGRTTSRSDETGRQLPDQSMEKPQSESSLKRVPSSTIPDCQLNQPFTMKPKLTSEETAHRMHQQDVATPRPSADADDGRSRPDFVSSPGGPSTSRPKHRVCQIETCGSDLNAGKSYNRRYKLCEACMKLPLLVVGGKQMRFCQQCSCLHPVGEFDGKKRSCRAQLNKHKARRKERETYRTKRDSDK